MSTWNDVTQPMLKSAYRRYRDMALVHEREGRVDAAWACLEAAHILEQRQTRHHIATHWAMLTLAWRTHDRRELIGQMFRWIAAGVATWIWVPVGNTGRANMAALKQLPLPTDLAESISTPG